MVKYEVHIIKKTWNSGYFIPSKQNILQFFKISIWISTLKMPIVSFLNQGEEFIISGLKSLKSWRRELRVDAKTL